MFAGEIRDLKKYSKGVALDTIGWLTLSLGAAIILVGKVISDKSLKAVACYDENGELIEESVEYF